jgi:acyl-coenzyme A synthetase/AMP-(fatty) acid ligase
MVFLTTHPVTEADTADGQVPIGRPLAGKQVQVLDERLRPAAQGELYSAGLGLALGYVGRPGLTAGRFVANPHGAPGERMYRTGDLARRRADGTLEFLGRSDDQVKVRGHRIELGDVQSAIATHPAVATSAAVLAEGHLVCFYTCRGGTVPAPEIRGHLATLLPDYMVPTRVFPMRHLPVTAHGKVNRAELARQAKQAMHVHGPACGRFCVGP